MKKIIVFLFATIIATNLVFAKKNLFSSLPDGDHVQRVYVGGQMLKLAGYITAVGKYNSVIKSASGIEVYNIENPSEKEKDAILKEINSITKKYGCEEAVRQQDGSESSVIYLLNDPNTQKDGKLESNGMLIVNIDNDEISLVYIAGTIDFNSLVL